MFLRPVSIYILVLVLLHTCNCMKLECFLNDVEIDEVIIEGIKQYKEEAKIVRENSQSAHVSKPKCFLNRNSKMDDDMKIKDQIGLIHESIEKAAVAKCSFHWNEIAESTRKSIEDETKNVLEQLHTQILMNDVIEEREYEILRRKRQADDTNTADLLCHDNVECNQPNSKYRSIDGLCNNLENPKWGAHGAVEPRYERNGVRMNPVFSNTGVDQPRKSEDGEDLPSARTISNILFSFQADENVTKSEDSNTLMAFNWGQFLDHDMVLTPVHGGEGGDIDCCSESMSNSAICLPITIPENDLFFQGSCMHMVRSVKALNESNKCQIGFKEVANELTSFIDGSAVYSSTNDIARDLRTGTDGLLDVRVGKKNRTLLPIHEDEGKGLCKDRGRCSRAGDIRVDVQPGLTLLHLLFVREHNRIAKELKDMNAHWNDNRIYNEARKIVGAIIQHITYNEYLLNVLDDPTREKYGLKLSNTGFVDEYDASVNPTIKNAFAAAAYRFGHSMIPPVEGLKKKNNRLVEDEFLEQIFLDQDFLLQKSARAVEMLAQYAITEPSREVDRFFESAIRNRLFENVEDVGFDLTALNIQRGRDHGLPAYVDWRVYCELDTEKLTSFQELHLTHDQHAIEQLRKAYTNVRDIDLYAGAMSEQRLPNSYVGPTFSCLIGEQFEALKKGDRFWYEMPTRQGFKEEQLAEIRKVTLALVMCNNFNMGKVQSNVFRPVSDSNPARNCGKIIQMSLSPWNVTDPNANAPNQLSTRIDLEEP